MGVGVEVEVVVQIVVDMGGGGEAGATGVDTVGGGIGEKSNVLAEGAAHDGIGIMAVER